MPLGAPALGDSPPRSDAYDKVRGAAVYLEDLRLPGLLYARALRSRYAHARILRIDASRAEAVPGVAAVVVGSDLPFLHGESLVDQPFLAREKVRYTGEAVAAVAAVDEATTEEALDRIVVDYEELPAVFDPLEAVRPTAPILHEELGRYARPPGIDPVPGTNIANHFALSRGDVAEAFARAHRVFEDTFTTPMQAHCTLEPHGAICQATAEGRVTLWTPNDSPYRCRKEIAGALGLRLGDVRVISPPNIGGNFGAKGGMKAEAIALAVAWKLRGRPIRAVFDREEEFCAAIGRHPSIVRMKTAVDAQGNLLAREVEIFLDSGAYAEKGPTVARFCGLSAAGPYRIPNVKVDVYCVYTNNTVAGAMRGYGGPQAAWAYETQMDVIAHELGLDPLELRLRHAYEDGDLHVAGQRLESEGLKDCLRAVGEAMEWGRAPRAQGRGRGIACMERAVKTPFGSAAFVKVNEDGTVDVLSSTTEVGQGSETVLRQIAAAELGVPLGNVRKVAPDTAVTPFDASTTSSRSTFHMGNAVRMAAADAREQLLELASPLLGAPPARLRIEDGHVLVEDAALAIPELLSRRFGPSGTVLGRGYYSPDMPDKTAEYYARFMVFWLLGACGAEVEVDEETGRVRVVQLWGAYDAGRVLHRANCEGMIEGGSAMGLGLALGEQVESRQGVVLNPSFVSYRVPTALDVPEVVPLLVEHPHPDGPFGAKGMAETTNVAVPPAIGNAIFDAVGVRIRSLPITPDKLLDALRRKARSPA
jgi:CO/xanthine dehydrogenase Mo-binding subunit